MNNCCTNIVPLGCISSCDEIETGIQATETGTWQALVKFNGVTLIREFAGVQGEVLKVPNGFAAGLLLYLRLKKPDGTPINDICYSFKNEITVQV